MMSAEQQTVSVVIPSKEGTATIRRTLRSLDAERERIKDVVLIFSNSTLAYKALCRELAQGEFAHLPITLLDAGHGNGSAARNEGALFARGDYVAFLDDDDEWFPHKIAAYEAYISRHQLTGDFVLFSKVAVTSADGDTIGIFPNRVYGGEPMALYLFSPGGGAQTSTLMLPASLAKTVLFDPSLPRHQDYDYCLSLSEHGAKFHLIDEVLARWHMQGDSVKKGGSFDFCSNWARQNKKRLGSRGFVGYFWKELYPLAKRTSSWAQLRSFYRNDLTFGQKMRAVLVFMNLVWVRGGEKLVQRLGWSR